MTKAVRAMREIDSDRPCSKNDPPFDSVRRLATAIMAAVAVSCIVLGLFIARLGHPDWEAFGVLVIGWGIGGLISASSLLLRSSRK